MDLVSYRKQGVVRVDLASRAKYSYRPRFVPKAGDGGGGPRFAWKVQLWTSLWTSLPQVSYTCHKPVSQVWVGLVFFRGGAGGGGTPLAGAYGVPSVFPNTFEKVNMMTFFNRII